MSVENNVHNRAPITVADGSGTKPGAPPGKPDPARTKAGNANAPVKPLPDVKPDPEPSPNPTVSTDIDNGLKDVRGGKFTHGEFLIAKGIRGLVTQSTGKDLLATYTEAKPVTDQILRAYSQRPPADRIEVVDGVDNYLQRIVIDGLLTADELGHYARFKEARETAKKYVTDKGLHRTPADRLQSMISAMEDLGATPFAIDATREACEEAIRSKPKTK